MAPNDYLKRVAFFRDNVLGYTGNECLIWPFDRNNKGYARLTIDGVRLLLHRHICRLKNGEPPEPKYDAAHSCGNGHLGCVNPRHLLWKTRKENEADKILHGTSNRGERCGNAKLKRSDVDRIISLKGVKSQRDIANEYGIHQVTVSKIHRGERWNYDATN